jgi:GTPase SAR1 family protein
MSSQADSPTESPESALLVDYDPAELRASLERELDVLEAQIKGGTNAEILGHEITRMLLGRLEDVRARAASKLRVVVLGDFKRGKSTLINALLREHVAPTDVLPETVTINEFSFGDSPSTSLRLEGGGRVAIRSEDLRSSQLSTLMERSPERITRVDVRAPISLLRDIVLVDTPGTGDLRVDLEQLVREYLDKADMLVLVVSANAPLSDGEYRMLRGAVAPREFSRICFVLNMVDTVRDEADIERLAQHVRHKVGGLFPGASVYPLSALDEFARVTQRPRPVSAVPLEPRFARFRSDLEQLTEAHSDVLLLDRSIRLADGAIAEMETRIKMLVEALSRRRADVETSLARESERGLAEKASAEARAGRVRARIRELAGEAAEWMAGFVGRLSASLPEQLSRSSKPDVERDFSFFLTDTLRGALAACLEAHEEPLGQLMRAELGEDIELAAGATSSFDRDLSSLAPGKPGLAELATVGGMFETWGYVYRSPAMLGIADALGSCLTMFNLAEVGLDFVRREEDLRALGDRFVRAKPALEETVRRLTKSSYESVAAQLAEKLEKTHAAQRETHMQTLLQARQLIERTEVEVDRTRGRLEATLAAIRDTKGTVMQLKSKLDATARLESVG